MPTQPSVIANRSGTFKVLSHVEYGEPSDVLSLGNLSNSLLHAGAHQVVVRIKRRLVHQGDLLIVRAASNGGPPAPIPKGAPRVPGFEGMGIIESLGAGVEGEGHFRVGQRVAFFSGAARSWAEFSVLSTDALVAVPDDVSDNAAAQALINTVTARTVLRAGHDSLPSNIEGPIHVLQTASASAVGRLITRIAFDLGVKPIRLVRSEASARALDKLLPGAPTFSTEKPNWLDDLRHDARCKTLRVAMDGVGGTLIDDLASLLVPGGSIISYGWLAGKGAPDLASLAPREISIRGTSIGTWFRTATKETRDADFQLAMRLAKESPELFAVAGEFALEDFQAAIKHMAQPGRTGGVILTSGESV